MSKKSIFVEYSVFDDFMTVPQKVELNTKEIDEALKKMPPNAYSFRFIDGHEISGYYYPKGEIWDITELEEGAIELIGKKDQKNLLVRCRLGNYHFFYEGDHVI